MNRKVLGIAVLALAAVMLTTPLMVSAKPTIKSVEFRIESWPDFVFGDWSKFKAFPAGVSGNLKLMKLPAYGTPPLIDDIPDPGNPAEWLPALLNAWGGVSFSIEGETEDMVGTVLQWVIISNTFTDGSVSAVEKMTFTFDDPQGTLEISAHFDKDGNGMCIGTSGTGYFEGAKFTGTFTTIRTVYDLSMIGAEGNAIFKIQEGTGEIMFH